MQRLIIISGWLLIIVSAWLFTRCTPIYYASNAHNVPLLKEKHEVKVSAGLTVTEDLAGPDVQAAYAVTENTGIITNATYLKGGSGSHEGDGYLVEIGAGYFKPIGSHLVAEVYGGGGFAKITNDRNYAPYSIKFVKPFLQPAFGFTCKYFDLALSPKIALVHYNEPFILNYEIQTDANGDIIYSNMEEKQTFFAFEPGITARGGWKYIKLQLQVIGSIQEIPYAQNLSINMSLSLNLAPRFRKVAQ